jgi:hypothetical protein
VRAAANILALFCLAVPSLHGQEQEQKLIDRVLRPNMELKNNAQQKSFNGGKSFRADAARVREFYFNQRVRTKSASAGSFQAKAHWQGDFKFSTTQAHSQGRFLIPNASTRVDTATHEVEPARESEKAARVNDYPTEKFQGRGTRQRALDLENAPRDPMTIDQVRELLNKPQ